MLQKLAVFCVLFSIFKKCLSCETDLDSEKWLADFVIDEQNLALLEAKLSQFDYDNTKKEIIYDQEQVSTLLSNLEDDLIKCENKTQSRMEQKLEDLTKQIQILTLKFESQIKEKDDKILKLEAEIKSLTKCNQTSEERAATESATIIEKANSQEILVFNEEKPSVDHFELPYCLEKQPKNLECLVSNKISSRCSTEYGVQPIYYTFGKVIRMLCSNIESPGWMFIQRRINGSVNFNRGWNEYKSGFGSFSLDFFLGLEKLHLITNSEQHELIIMLIDSFNQEYYACYDDFKIGNEQSRYTLKSLGKFLGNAGNWLQTNLNMPFITWDSSNSNMINCAAQLHGGWWSNLNRCVECNLNGRYGNAIFWGHTKFKNVQILIRPSSANNSKIYSICHTEM